MATGVETEILELRLFPAASPPDPAPHRWRVGYRGLGLKSIADARWATP